jgi:hypothetical protein
VAEQLAGRLEGSLLETTGDIATASPVAGDGGKTPRLAIHWIDSSENAATETLPKLPFRRVKAEGVTAGETAQLWRGAR